jgi:magnesium transporter
LQGFDLNALNDIPKNFDILVIIMVSIAVVSLFIFWKKGWILSNKKTVIDYKENK